MGSGEYWKIPIFFFKPFPKLAIFHTYMYSIFIAQLHFLNFPFVSYVRFHVIYRCLVVNLGIRDFFNVLLYLIIHHVDCFCFHAFAHMFMALFPM